jgi:hypothetical protein
VYVLTKIFDIWNKSQFKIRTNIGCSTLYREAHHVTIEGKHTLQILQLAMKNEGKHTS